MSTDQIEVIEMRRTSAFTSMDEIEICLIPQEIDYKLKLPSLDGCKWEHAEEDDENSQLQVGKLASGNYMIRAFPDFEE